MLSPLVLLFSLDTKMAFHLAKLKVLHCSGGGKMLTIKCDLQLDVTYILNSTYCHQGKAISKR